MKSSRATVVRELTPPPADGQQDEFYHRLFETIQTGVIVVDAARHQVADANPVALKMYGGRREDLIGRSCAELFCLEGSHFCQTRNECASVLEMEGRFVRHDGREMPVLKNYSVFKMGERELLLISLTDLTERKHLDEQLWRAKEAAEAANNTKSVFLANMSHEIRTPMNAVLGYTQLLLRDPDLTARQAESLRIIERSGRHLLELINEILDLSKVESGHVALNPQVMDFHDLLDDLRVMFQVRTMAKGLTLRTERTPTVPRLLVADGGKVRQALINMLGNAVKFTDTGGIVLRAEEQEMGGEGADRYALIAVEVEDTGCGIAPEELGKVFEQFEQAAGGRKKGGTGLGMHLSREYAQLMGGDLTVTSALGRGSTFRFEFVARLAADAEARSIAAAPRHVERLAPAQREWRALVVDDDADNRQLLLSLLSTVGFQARIADSGAEALRLFGEWTPDVVLMDLRMHGMDGLETSRRIKATPVGRNIPIIIGTASTAEEKKIRQENPWIDGFVHKPFQEEHLFEEIRRLAGVEYVYATPPGGAAPVATVADAESCRAEDLSVLPASSRAALREALELGDKAQALALVAALDTAQPALAARVRAQIESYNYESLQKWLELVEKNA